MKRLRRLRKDNVIRDLVSQTQISSKNLIMPYFVVEGNNRREEIKSMPGVFHLSVDNLLMEIEKIKGLGINSILIFGIPQKKDSRGRQAFSKNGIVQRAISAIKERIEDIAVITDVCLCGYTTYGHCGIVKTLPPERDPAVGGKNYIVDNDATLKILANVALSHAEAGADFVAPSAMMDGQVEAIRKRLDKAGFKDTGILSYSAKYGSNFYGPFRDALDSAPQFGDRKTYQMDFRNSDEALKRIREDIDEGADIVMVKPALSYLDIICRVKREFNIPIAAYNVSGEYAMVKRYCEGIEDRIARKEVEKELVLEILTSIKRAGADIIITYWAEDVARWLAK